MNDFIGIGAQKCASSWLYEVLNSHSQAYMSDTKELDFFSYYYDKGYEWYHRNFYSNGNLMSGEISPSYFYDQDVPARVKRYNKDIKILLCLRDPVKRMFSNHLHEVRAGNVTGENTIFENALNNNPLYLEQSLYAKHLKRWLKYFEKDQILVVFQEDINNNPIEVYKQVCRFLNITEDENFMGDFHVNDSTVKKNPFIGMVFELGGVFLRRLGLKSAVDTLKRRGLISRLYKGNKTHLKDVVKPMMSETKSKLRLKISESDAELKVILGLSALPWE